MIDLDACDLLASLLGYPDSDALHAHRSGPLPSSLPDGATAAITRFRDEIADLNPGELQELYTGTFDLNPVTALEIGWHLHGETYERGAFLVRMRDLLGEAGVAEGFELPDHLPSLIRALPRIPDERAKTLAVGSILPALEKMCSAVSASKSSFRAVLDATTVFLSNQYGAEATA